MQTLTPLTRPEDAWLRRLHFVEVMGAALAPPFAAVKRELRLRDKRLTIREPFERDVLQPG